MFVSDKAQVKTFDAVFFAVFGTRSRHQHEPPARGASARVPAPPDERPRSIASAGAGARGTDRSARERRRVTRARRSRRAPSEHEVLVPMAPSDEELLRGKRFDALEPHEIAQLYRLMTRLELATPVRRTRRAQSYRHGSGSTCGERCAASMRTGGDPIRLARRRRRVVRRRLVLLCDISGSMEPYARAYLQFLDLRCAAAAPTAEAFVFATRLTRLTRALASRNPERAIQQAAAAAPDWSSGTRIGDALKDVQRPSRPPRDGARRGDRDPLRRLGAGRPGARRARDGAAARASHTGSYGSTRGSAASGFAPHAGGMEAALPHCDALVSGHSLSALDEVVGRDRRPSAPASVEPPTAATLSPSPKTEPWASATPVRGSSVAMPSGYGPSRGKTTPGWGLGWAMSDRAERRRASTRAASARRPRPICSAGPQPSFCELEDAQRLDGPPGTSAPGSRGESDSGDSER